MVNEIIDIDNFEQMGECYDEYGNVVPCPQETSNKNVQDVTLQNQGELEYANSVIEDYTNDALAFPATFEALPMQEVIGGTYEIPVPVKKVKKETLVFSQMGSTKAITYEDEKLTPLEQNYKYVNDILSVYDKNDYDLVNKLFTTLNKIPVIDGKPLDMNKLPELMKDPAMKQKIMKVASQYEKLPEVQTNWDLTWELNMSHLRQEVLRDRIQDANTIIATDLKSVAGQLDSEYKVKYKNKKRVNFSELFNEKGQLLSEKEYNDKLNKAADAAIAEYKKQNPTFSWEGNTVTPYMYQYKDNTSVASRPVYNEATKRYEYPENNVWKNSIEGQADAFGKFVTNNTIRPNEFPYKDMVAKLYEQYNKPNSKGVNKVKTLFDSMDNPFNSPIGNTGGRMQAVPKRIKYDLANGLLDENKDATPEALEFKNILELAGGDNKSKLFYDIGDVKGELPEDKDASIQTFLIQAAKEIASGKHGKEYMPSGSIKFQNIATGDKNMHAYNVTFDTDFLKRFVGTKDDKGPLFTIHENKEKWEDIKNNGITIYAPKDISEGTHIDLKSGEEVENTLFGKYSKRATITSPYESQFRRRNKINITIPNCGSRTIIRNNDNSISIVGYNLSLNPRTKNYEKVLINQANIPGANFFDLDDLIERTVTDMKDIYDNNGQIHSSLLYQQNSK